MTMSFSFGYGGSDEGVDGTCSCEGMRGLCDWVASEGSIRTGSGCSSLGSVLCGNRKDKMILQMWHSGGGDDRVLGGRRTRRDGGRCLQGRFLVHK